MKVSTRSLLPECERRSLNGWHRLVRSTRRAAFIIFLVSLWGCDRYPSTLSSTEQVQALVFEHHATRLFAAPSAKADALRLFLCAGDPKGETSAGVRAYVTRSFPSARPYAAEDEHAHFQPFKERGTGRGGLELHLEAFAISGDGPVTVRATQWRGGSKDAAGYEYRLQRIDGRWKILDSTLRWES